MAGWTGLEPATFRVTGGRSIQAELPPHIMISTLVPALFFFAGAPDRSVSVDWAKSMAPRAGIEPATQRLTVVCSTSELPRNKFQRKSA